MSDEREQRTPQDWPSWADFGEDPLVVVELPDRNDGRGDAFHLPHDALEWLGPAAEMHLVTARRGAVRGDHLHERRRELILVRAAGPWELAWRVPGGDTARRTFREPGAVLLAVEPGTAHALRNLSDDELVIVSCSSGRWDPDDSDTRRVSLFDEL
jgi:dTDP-4-dehydrorhamnose 3,5-epimerase-like enzyme